MSGGQHAVQVLLGILYILWAPPLLCSGPHAIPTCKSSLYSNATVLQSFQTQVPEIHRHALTGLFSPLIQLFRRSVITHYTVSSRRPSYPQKRSRPLSSSYRRPRSNPVLVTCCRLFGVRMRVELLLVPGFLAPSRISNTQP